MTPRSVLLFVAGAAIGAGLLAVLLWGVLDLSWPPSPATASEEPSTMAETVPDLYTCGMHPDVIRHEPGPCPICGMKLVPRKSDMEEESGDGVRVAQGFLQNFAVRTTEVSRGSLPISIRTIGVLAHNEERLVSVNTKFEGWIEKAYVNNVGESVAEGDLLFEIYSPQLVTTQREYLAAMEYAKRLAASGAYPEAIARAESLLDAARERLRYWDITDAQIDALEDAGEASRTLRFFAPASGFIVAKMGDSLAGMKLEPGMTVLKIADHSTLWAEAKFYEEDLRHVHEGTPASIEVDAFPGRTWDGRILFFRSAVDAETRALTAFVEIDNADLALRPMMYVDVSIRAQGVADALIVPAESVLHTGERSVVVVARDDRTFEPREVALGLASEGRQVVTSGLDVGERVVVSSQFLIDSESNLKAAIAQLLGDGEADDGESTGAMPGHHHH